MKGTVKVKLEMLPTRGPSIDFNIEASCSLSKVGDIALTDESIRDEICKAVRAAFDAEIDEVRRKFGELETHATFVRGAPVVERGAMDVPLTDDELAMLSKLDGHLPVDAVMLSREVQLLAIRAVREIKRHRGQTASRFEITAPPLVLPPEFERGYEAGKQRAEIEFREKVHNDELVELVECGRAVCGHSNSFYRYNGGGPEMCSICGLNDDQCCPRDSNHDGNCDVHSAPGVLRIESKR